MGDIYKGRFIPTAREEWKENGRIFLVINLDGCYTANRSQW